MTALVTASAALAGCAPAAPRSDAANVLGSVAEHLDTASSAVATASLVVEQTDAGRLFAPTADAAVGDAVESVTAAVHGIGTLVVPDDATRTLRDEALAAASDAIVPVADVRTWLGGGGEDGDGEGRRAVGRALLDALDDASVALDEAHAAVVRVESAEAAG